MANRLAAEASAYLNSAAHQPVAWYPWGEAAFAAAKAGGKPVLLDIGAVWCHWCHVMDGESYEDAKLAEFLNANFVCVKVDRDERPDVDSRYQRAVQALSGQGGWPLTAFLTDAGDVFYGGTYFPPDGKYGRPGFRTVLERVLEIYRTEREKVDATATELKGHVATMLAEGKPGVLSQELLDNAGEAMARLFDWRYGGFGTAPKFPHPGAIELLLARWWDTGAPWMKEIAERTLSGMARGGMYDQVGGGFHRYSVDERWCVPHFEKMSYDNAELLKAYLHGWATLGNPLFRETAEGIVAWNLEVMCDLERGGFAASQDADVGLHDDGDYFTWTADEAHAVMDPNEWAMAHRHWDIYDNGEMHHNPAKNVLWVARSTAALAEELKVEESKVNDWIESARAKLKLARDAREAPFVDRSVYVSWNAMMCDAFLEAGAYLDRKDCTDFALKTLELLWKDGFVPGSGMLHRLPTHHAPRTTHWLLDDQVQSAAAFLTAFEHTGAGEWLDRARELVDMTLAFYWDDAEGGFFDSREQDMGFLSTRGKPIQDAPTASSNGVAALVMLRLAVITEESKYKDRAERLLGAFAGRASELGIHGSTYLRALDWLIHDESKIVVYETTTNSMTETALSFYRPRRVVVRKKSSPVPNVAAPVALVCAGAACAAPVTTVETLRQTLESFGRPR